ncbi:transcriptional regulator [Nonomuraea sp. SYSU D8015]|uniref:transcriptional regulator n=1 Tax=Nonomuraea sp. SYSU D8015 TaxID=2593644 RepID=UPI001660B7A6|nr:transcriptional regulator [Nonomuraea sp. SYSU D8015]
MSAMVNRELADLMAEAGMSNKKLAGKLRELALLRGLPSSYTHVYVARWLEGMRPRGETPHLIASVLGRELGRVVTLDDIGMTSTGAHLGPGFGLDFSTAPPTILRTTRKLWEADLARDQLLRLDDVPAKTLLSPMGLWLIAVPPKPPRRSGRARKVTEADVERVRLTTHLFEDLDHRFGGEYRRQTAVQYLHREVSELLHGQYVAAVGRELFAAAAVMTYKVGAMAYDSGLHGLARRYFMQALNLAHAAGDPALAGKVWALMSHQANFLGEYGEAVAFARAAKLGAEGAATPVVHAMYCAMEARALASLGDRRNAIAALREAERSFGKGRSEAEPDWIAYFDRAELCDEFGHSFAALGDKGNAIEFAQLTLDESSDRFPRSRVFAQLTLAGAHLAGKPLQKEVEQACLVAGAAIERAGRIRSARVREYITRFNRSLTPYEKARAVGDFREQWRDVLRRCVA